MYEVVAAIDKVTSAPKEVSILWAIAGPEERKKIELAHALANTDALKLVQGEHAQTRTGKGGHRKEQLKLVVGQFVHITSRIGAPQLHTHNPIFSVGVRADGKYGALNTRKLLKKGVSRQLGQYYRDSLRQKLALEFPELKFPTVNITGGTSFRIVGCDGEEIPESLIRQLSSRRAAIEAACKKNPSKAKHQIAVETRDRKVEVVDRDEFFARHRRIAKEHGFNVQAFLAHSRQQHIVTTATKAMVTAMA